MRWSTADDTVRSAAGYNEKILRRECLRKPEEEMFKSGNGQMPKNGFNPLLIRSVYNAQRSAIRKGLVDQSAAVP